VLRAPIGLEIDLPDRFPKGGTMQLKRSLSVIIATILLAAVPLAASPQVSVGVAVGFGGPGWGVGFVGYAPPALPAYYQPPAPYPNWQWVPGYWGSGYYGYYWVPGYWTAPPVVGYYWTPGYWGYANGGYVWNGGYWGPTVGFYGGINYGYGYFGVGFAGGYWSGGIFNYNTAVVNVNRTVIRNTYVDKTVVHRDTISHSRVSFDGGRGGIRARPTAAQVAARRHGATETAAQRAHQRVAARDRDLLATANHGRPRLAAVQKPMTAAHHPAHMHAITAADRRAAQRATAHHGMVTAAAHHNAPAHGTVSAAAHHYAPSRGTVSAHSYPHFGYAAHPSYSHAAYGGRPPSGAYPHGVSGARPPSGGAPHGAPGGGHPGGGGGRPPRG
jgi:hypothetical protein